MTDLPAIHLQYPQRRYGMDHDRYAWSNLFERPKIAWPNGARVAVCRSIDDVAESLAEWGIPCRDAARRAA